ncbi:tetratricopeptide repeat protein [Candidatus Magnetaquicoccus inordinatus]|uniref:tetratricopeptide repeat protein n=1 Tax=Candidatus Magnetaquicoccus inordinatus TaxID=2496818 RepID=UPI00187D1CA0|nr:tetratricopeptide repeat protein [Candidatus Magnetaquicoccus inordinatus]
MNKPALFLLLFELLFSVPLSAGELEQLRIRAEAQEREAQYRLGERYFEGKGVAIDYAEAMYWWRRAAEQQDPRAQNGVGTLYDNGKGVKKDYREAARWFRLAANQGHLMARRNLGWMHEKGQGFPVNLVKAYKWQYLAEMSRKPRSSPQLTLPCPLCDKLAQKMTPEQIAQGQQLAQQWQPNDPEE